MESEREGWRERGVTKEKERIKEGLRKMEGDGGDSSLQTTRFHCFTPLQPTLGIAHGDLRLACGCSAMETHFMKLPTHSSCADVASRGSLEHGSECCNPGQMIVRATRFSTQRCRSVSLCGLPLHD